MSDLTDVKNTAQFLMNKAVTEVIQAHRQTNVRFKLPTDTAPNLDVTHTVNVDIGNLEAQGKVRAIKEVFNIDSASAITEVELAISALKGVGTTENFTTSVAVNTPTTKTGSNVASSTPLTLDNFYYGYDPAPGATDQGYVGNTNDPADANPTEFRLITPEISSVETSASEEVININFRVPIKEDILII